MILTEMMDSYRKQLEPTHPRVDHYLRDRLYHARKRVQRLRNTVELLRARGNDLGAEKPRMTCGRLRSKLVGLRTRWVRRVRRREFSEDQDIA